MEKQIHLSTSGTARRYDVDWLRILAVLLLIPFHSARLFDTFDNFYVKNAELSLVLSILIAFIDPWHMALLFLLAGAATWYAIDIRGGGGYVKERVKRLLVPFFFGMVVLVPPQMYFAALHHSTFAGSFLEYIPFYLTPHNVNTDYTGLELASAHLWFIQFLFIFSLVALPLFLFLKRRPAFFDWLAALCNRRGGILLLAIPYWLIRALIEIYGQSRFAHIVLFVYGFLLMGSPRLRDAITRDRRIALTMGGLTMLGYFAPFVLWGVTSFPQFSVGDILHFTDRTLNTWFWVVAILGYGQRYLNFTNPVQKYANEAVYPFYLLHQTVIVILGYFVVQWGVNLWIKYPVIGFGALVLTLLVYDVCVKRWNVTRFLFGMKLIPHARVKQQLAPQQ